MIVVSENKEEPSDNTDDVNTVNVKDLVTENTGIIIYRINSVWNLDAIKIANDRVDGTIKVFITDEVGIAETKVVPFIEDFVTAINL